MRTSPWKSVSPACSIRLVMPEGPGDVRVEFVLKTDSGYPRDAEVTLFTLANPQSFLCFNTHWSAPPVSALAHLSGSNFWISFLSSSGVNVVMMMMIAFITVRSSLVPLLEGLCAQIYFRFEISVVCVHIFCFSFSEEKIC